MSDKKEAFREHKNLTDPMRIFPILNKFDRIWSANLEKPFCEIYKDITKGKDLTDMEFTQLMEIYIDEKAIK